MTIQALGWRSGGRYLPLQDDIASRGVLVPDAADGALPPAAGSRLSRDDLSTTAPGAGRAGLPPRMGLTDLAASLSSTNGISRRAGFD